MEAPARFDRYEVLAPLGVGGMGEVVKARAVGPHGFEKLVAIKRIRAEWAQQETMANRFIREAQIAARLQHANIVQVFDFGRHGDELFLVMELVEGQSLDDILASLAEKGKRPTLAQTLQIALDVSRALESAHGLESAKEGGPRGVVHRDVSPANVMISRQGVVKLTDFGIAAWAKHQARTSLVAGKPLYMAPEQIRGDSLDGRTDLFAVGLLMYEMIAGRRPWSGMVDPSPDASLESMDYRDPSSYTTMVPSEVDELVRSLLALEADDRPDSAGEVARALVDLSYKLQIVLDPSELRPLVGETKTDAHAPTQPSSPSRPETLVATGVSPDGVTVLASENASSTSPVTSPGAPQSRPWLWVALVLFAIGGVGFALAASGGGDDPEVAVAESPPAPEAPPASEVEPEPEPTGEAEAEAEGTPEEPELTPGSDDPVEEPTEPVAEPATATPQARTRRRRASTTSTSTTARTESATDTAPSRSPPRRGGANDGEVGTVNIAVSQAWGNLSIDGSSRGTAPVQGLELSPGRHRIRVVNPHSGLVAERTVNVVSGQTQLVQLVLSAPE